MTSIKVRYEMFLTEEGAVNSKYSPDYSDMVLVLPNQSYENVAVMIMEEKFSDVRRNWGGEVMRFVVLYDELKHRIGVYKVVFNCESGKARNE
jgi:hypothetical protein